MPSAMQSAGLAAVVCHSFLLALRVGRDPSVLPPLLLQPYENFIAVVLSDDERTNLRGTPFDFRVTIQHY
jgi:hypothetical protein